MPVQELTQSALLSGDEGEVIELSGIRAVFKTPPAGSTSGWMALDYTLAPRQMGAPLHYHRELIESFYVISGELWIRVGDKETIAGPGSYALVMPGTLHSFANRSDAPVRFLGHASDGKHKEFLTKLFGLAQKASEWPPRDPTEMLELSRNYDVYYF